MKDEKVNVQYLKDKVKEFIEARDWSQYHSPKNVCMSLAIEVAELMEHFQWETCEESKSVKASEEIKDEIADIAVYLLDLCNIMDVDLSKSVCSKLTKNSKKYPVQLTRGKAHKYTHYTRRKKDGQSK